MSTIKTTYIQHPSSATPNVELAADGTVVLPLSDLEDLANVGGSPTDGQVLEYDAGTSSWGPATFTVPPDSAFDSLTTITSSNSTWPIPSLGSPVVRVTAVGGGGGGGAGDNEGGSTGGNGGTTTFQTSAGTLTAAGGHGGNSGGFNVGNRTGVNGLNYLVSGNGGEGGVEQYFTGMAGQGGEIRVAYYDLTGISTANVTIGAGGARGTYQADGGTGGSGAVIFEYKAS